MHITTSATAAWTPPLGDGVELLAHLPNGWYITRERRYLSICQPNGSRVVHSVIGNDEAVMIETILLLVGRPGADTVIEALRPLVTAYDGFVDRDEGRVVDEIGGPACAYRELVKFSREDWKRAKQVVGAHDAAAAARLVQTAAAALAEERTRVAEQAYLDYDFGPDVEVEDQCGWEYTTSREDWERVVYVAHRGSDGPTTRVVFRVRFGEGADITECSASDGQGGRYGHLPTLATADVATDQPAD